MRAARNLGRFKLITPTGSDTHRAQILDAFHDYVIYVALLERHLDHTVDELIAPTLFARARPHLDPTTATLVVAHLTAARRANATPAATASGWRYHASTDTQS